MTNNQAAVETIDPKAPTLDRRVRAFRVGERIGGVYEVLSILGEGGMGVVYDARDTLLNRLVAIKVPLTTADAQRLRKEAQGLAALHHPNLVNVHALGQHDGVDFMVMERVLGASLQQEVDNAIRTRRPIPIGRVIHLLIAVTDGLTAVHRAGITHRDVKIANVLVTGERVVLTDFGLVTPEFDAHIASQSVAGSIDSMAPEQIRGDVETGKGPLVDLYALGVMAFTLLTGRPPYYADDPLDTFRGHLTGRIPDVRATRPDTPRELAELVRELLAKSPDDRPEAAEVVLWRLTAIRAAEANEPLPEPMRVVVVDDEPAICHILKKSLLAALPQLSVESTTSPEAALAHVERHKVDLVVVDLRMPEVNGVELSMHLLGLPDETRPLIVAMSAGADDRDLEVLASIGVSRFVAKDERFVAHMCDVIGDLRRARARAR